MTIDEDDNAGLKILLSFIFLATYFVGTIILIMNKQWSGLGIWIFVYPLTYGLLHSFVFDKKKIKEIFLAIGISVAGSLLIVLEVVIPMMIGAFFTVFIAGALGVSFFWKADITNPCIIVSNTWFSGFLAGALYGIGYLLLSAIYNFDSIFGYSLYFVVSIPFYITLKIGNKINDWYH